MSTFSVSVSDKLKQKMLEVEDINWSSVARRAFEEILKQQEFLKKVSKEGNLTYIASEKVLAKDWNSKEDEEAWKDL